MASLGKNFKIFLFLLIFSLLCKNSYALKCYECEFSDKDCTINPEKVKDKECTKEGVKPDEWNCKTVLDDEGRISRGCIEQEHCKDDKNNCCKTPSDNCNKEIMPSERTKCHTCDNCRKTESGNVKHCHYYKKDSAEPDCFTVEIGDKVVRGCVEDDKHMPDENKVCKDDKCDKCKNEDGKECNHKEVPVLVECFECDEKNEECTIEPQKIKTTKKCTEGQVCFTKLDKTGKVSRGCIKDEDCTENDCTPSKESKSNNLIKPEDRPQCHVCKDCTTTKDENKKYCLNYNKESTIHCFTVSNGGKVERGCLEDDKVKEEKDRVCKDDNKFCAKCTYDKQKGPCNGDKYESKLQCYDCRSDINSDCIANVAGGKIKTKTCSKEEKGCYSENYNGLIMRSCAEILSESEYTNCTNPSFTSCKTCQGSGCNTEKINGSAILSSSVIGITILFILLNIF